MSAFCMGVRNDAGVYNARKGHYDGGEYIFTHRNPSNGHLWGEDIPNSSDDSNNKSLGKWVPAEEVTLV